MSSLLPLHAAHPALAQAYPVAGLLRGPTRVQPLAGTRDCWLKRDDLTAADYGGNKIRKLDFLLADAQRRGKKTLVAFGYAGSNFVAATAWHGRKLGLRTIGCLLPQANAGYVADNLSVSLAAGAELIARPKKFPLVRAAAAASLKAWRRDSAWPLWIPPGGSNALGALGYVNAAYELKAQIDARAVPAPQAIYLPISSMGSVAGLVAGLALAGLDVQIVAVQVVDEKTASARQLGKLIAQLRELLARSGIATPATEALLQRVDIRTEFYGSGYALPAPGAAEAIARFTERQHGTRADLAYSGKALACFYQDLDRGHLPTPALYWHTYSAQALPPGVTRAAREQVPEALRGYWS